MARAETGLWWYRCLHAQVARVIETHPHGRNAAVVDAGCGTGGLLLSLRQLGFTKLSGYDVSPEAVRTCRERGLEVALQDLRGIGNVVEPGSADVIVSNDTLCYFDHVEQEAISRNLSDALAPGGLLVLNLPALAAFRGIHDLAVGIGSRFSKADVRRLMPGDLFELVEQRFWPLLLSPLIYVARLRQRRRLRKNPALEPRSDVVLPPAPLNGLFGLVTRIELMLPPVAPFASSLFLVGRKRGGNQTSSPHR